MNRIGYDHPSPEYGCVNCQLIDLWQDYGIWLLILIPLAMILELIHDI